MIKFAEAAEQIAGTTKKLEKTRIVADYLKSRAIEEASISALFFSGRPFPVWEETTLQVGGSLLWRIVAELSGKAKAELTAAYRQLGDLGAVAGAVLLDQPRARISTVFRWKRKFRDIASSSWSRCESRARHESFLQRPSLSKPSTS